MKTNKTYWIKSRNSKSALTGLKNDISGKLHADFAEQATQLENRDVLLEILRVSEEELESTRKNLGTLD